MKFKEWFLERFPIDYDKFVEFNEKIFIKEPIPTHMKKWLFVMGATPLILFGFQVLTGLFLTFYFMPSPEMAYESIRHITEDVRFGYWVRGMHRWGANLMIISLLLHMTRVFFTQAYRKPRELNWIIGVLLFFLTMTISFTGYSLTYNQLSYWATTVGTNMIKEVPLIGDMMLFFLRGGDVVNANTLTRFYTLHVMILPGIIFFFIFLHIVILRLHGVSIPEGFEEKYYPFYPHHFYKIIIATLFLLTLMSTLTVILPPGIGEPANPAITPQHIKPEWYFFPTYRFLKMVPLHVGIYATAAFVLVFTFWPFIEPLISKDKTKRTIFSRTAGVLTLVITLILTIWETIVI
ncbi:cytochrome b [Caldithrix abyssi]|uniref:Cytochrome b/b6 domain-containing protein n=1 Tax=Caldithrix abyssi DSM 13497 TaxID=880073 RepID=H1XYE4_CALAY|nr:cytochrome bc complex cytochrome b subunit [Caldithrix abyssi]APF19306.1 ubiquinol-cytochrome c reductase cytochrome b subunit/cytochrome b6 [Caldithrix abyssi DSM 13497]EHO43211.1 Cytochrome b/b6 domain-containing protein [Caldithrix abyssi DSM 13497]